jgi:FG-GAP repeat
LALCALLIGPAFVGAPGRGAHARALESSGSLGSLPPAARGVVSAALGGDDRGFWVSRAGTGLTASNPAQCLAFTFSGGAVAVAGGQGRASLAVAGVGYGRRLRSLGPAASVAQRNRVGFDYGMLSEWFVNGPLGLEQGFTLRRPPTGSRRGPLSIVMRVSGSLGVRVARGAESAEFLARGGRVALSYTGLRATDASGRVLEAWLSASAGGLAIRVGDRGARYPVTVDPFIQQGPTLVGTDASGSDRQGSSVALSADGNTALVGGLTDDGNRGAAWVFTRSGGVWRQQGPKLVGTGAIGAAAQGVSVVLSADGNTALVGGPFDNDHAGAAWVFTRSGGVWRQQGSKLTGAGATGSYPLLGSSVALSADGNTALLGGPHDNGFAVGGAGAAWVFTRSDGVWSQQGSKLVGAGATASQQGLSVALSADGNTALVGGPGDGGTGAAWVFTRSGGVWRQQGPKLVGTGAIVGFTPAREGFSVALSADGNTALLGGPGDNNGLGAAWVFTRSRGVWSQQGPKLVGTGGQGSLENQGYSVALSADGNTALVGGPHDNSFGFGAGGAAWVFTRAGGLWRQQGPKLVGTGATGGPPHVGGAARQGFSVALSADGNTALVGGPNDGGGGINGHSGHGAAWVFTRSGGVWTQQGPKLVGTDSTFDDNQGFSVALSADGNTALVGGPFDHRNGFRQRGRGMGVPAHR